jgi:type I restriction enzyme S subunit
VSFPRYPAYKESGVEWLGPIPSHWHPAPVKRLFEIVGGSTPASDDPTFWDGEIPWATPADLGNGPRLRLERTLRAITSAGLASCSTTMVPRGSIVLSTRAPIGSIAIASVPLCTNQGCKSLVPRGTSDARCFAYLLSIATAALNVRGRGATFLELSGEELGRFQLPSAPVDEQQAIADFLDRETAKIDALVAEQERLIELLKEKRQAVISHAVTKGLNPDVPMKDSGVEWIGQTPDHWNVAPLGHLCEALSYGFTNPMPTADDGPHMLTANDIDYGRVRYESSRRTTRSAYENDLTAKSRPLRGDILVTKDGTLGRVAVHDGREACINQSVAFLRLRRSVEPDFAALALLADVYQRRMQEDAGGTTIKHIYISRLAKMPIAYPPIAEQVTVLRSLAGPLQQLDTLVDDAQRAVVLLQERRTALISAAVTGQIDVRGASAARAH